MKIETAVSSRAFLERVFSARVSDRNAAGKKIVREPSPILARSQSLLCIGSTNFTKLNGNDSRPEKRQNPFERILRRFTTQYLPRQLRALPPTAFTIKSNKLKCSQRGNKINLRSIYVDTPLIYQGRCHRMDPP